jgi:MFS superfamily sulfate permease-like transporter
MLLFPALVSDMPSPTLAAIVITASFGLFDWPATKWLYRSRRSEFLLALAAMLGVVFLGVLEGILVAIGLSLANFVRKAWWPHSTELGKIKGRSGYHDRDRHPEAELEPGLILVRFDAPLFFANAPSFGRRLQGMLEEADRPIHRVVVVGNAITDIDTTGAEILADVLDDMERKGIAFEFAGLKGHVRDRLGDYGLVDRIGLQSFHSNTISAVKSHRQHLEESGSGDL